MSIITEKIHLTVELASFMAISPEAKNQIVNQIYMNIHEIGREHEFLVGKVNLDKPEEFIDEPPWEGLERPPRVRATRNLSLAEYIQEKRLAAGLSQVKMGRVMGMSDSCVSLWESGKALPIRSNLLKIAKALNCPKKQLNKLWRKEMNDRKLFKVVEGIANEVDQQAQPAADVRERDTAADIQPREQRDIRHGDPFATANSSITTTTF